MNTEFFNSSKFKIASKEIEKETKFDEKKVFNTKTEKGGKKEKGGFDKTFSKSLVKDKKPKKNITKKYKYAKK